MTRLGINLKTVSVNLGPGSRWISKFESSVSLVVYVCVWSYIWCSDCRAPSCLMRVLQSKLESSSDRLSLFGLMVKPVQRFPQFIMLLQVS